MSKEAQGVELPNNLVPDNYPQKFVQSTMHPKGTSNEAAKLAPTLDEVMHGFTKYPCY